MRAYDETEGGQTHCTAGSAGSSHTTQCHVKKPPDPMLAGVEDESVDAKVGRISYGAGDSLRSWVPFRLSTNQVCQSRFVPGKSWSRSRSRGGSRGGRG